MVRQRGWGSSVATSSAAACHATASGPVIASGRVQRGQGSTRSRRDHSATRAGAGHRVPRLSGTRWPGPARSLTVHIDRGRTVEVAHVLGQPVGSAAFGAMPPDRGCGGGPGSAPRRACRAARDRPILGAPRRASTTARRRRRRRGSGRAPQWRHAMGGVADQEHPSVPDAVCGLRDELDRHAPGSPRPRDRAPRWLRGSAQCSARWCNPRRIRCSGPTASRAPNGHRGRWERGRPGPGRRVIQAESLLAEPRPQVCSEQDRGIVPQVIGAMGLDSQQIADSAPRSIGADDERRPNAGVRAVGNGPEDGGHPVRVLLERHEHRAESNVDAEARARSRRTGSSRSWGISAVRVGLTARACSSRESRAASAAGCGPVSVGRNDMGLDILAVLPHRLLKTPGAEDLHRGVLMPEAFGTPTSGVALHEHGGRAVAARPIAVRRGPAGPAPTTKGAVVLPVAMSLAVISRRSSYLVRHHVFQNT